MERVLQLMVEIVEFDLALCDSLARLYNAHPDLFADEVLCAIADRANPLYTRGEFNRLTGGRFHAKVARKLAEAGHLYECSLMLDKRCDQFTYTQVLMDFTVSFDQFRDMKALGYERDIRIFDKIFTTYNRWYCHRDHCMTLVELFREMVEEHPDKAARVDVYSSILYRTFEDFNNYCFVILEARSKGVELKPDMKVLRQNFEQCQQALDFDAKCQLLLDVLSDQQTDAYDLLLDLVRAPQELLSVVRHAKKNGTVLNPLKGVIKFGSRVVHDAYVVDILKETNLFNDAAISALPDATHRAALLKVALRNKRWCNLSQSIEQALLENPRANWLQRTFATRKGNELEIKKALERGHVATALQLLTGRCSNETVGKVLCRASKCKELAKRAASKKIEFGRLGFSIPKTK